MHPVPPERTRVTRARSFSRLASNSNAFLQPRKPFQDLFVQPVRFLVEVGNFQFRLHVDLVLNVGPDAILAHLGRFMELSGGTFALETESEHEPA